MTDLASDTTDERRRRLLRKMMADRGLELSADATRRARIPRRPPGLQWVPQSFAQQRLWFLDRLAPGNPFYTVSLAVPIRAAVDRVALQRALDDIVRRHEALRTTFAEADGQPMQRIAAPHAAALEFVELGHLGARAREDEAERLAQAETARSFDLERGPLMVAKLLTLGATDHLLLLTLHHIVCDGWSLRVLSRELMGLYGAHATGAPAALPELPVQYADFALWQSERLGGGDLERQLAYWRQALHGAPELHLWPDRARPAVPSFRGGLVPLRIDASRAAAVARLAAQANTTPFVVLMAAFMVLLGRLSAQDDIVVGTPIANRTEPELEPLIGFFVNTLVLRGDLSGAPAFVTLVERLHARALDAYANQDLPFERLVEDLAPQRVLGRNPLFQVIFQLFSAHDGAPGDTAPAARQRGTAKFDLRLDLWPAADGGYAGELEFSADVFAPARVQRMARHFCTLLASLLEQPGHSIDEAQALEAEELRLLLHEYNDTAAPFPADAGIAQLFAEVARRHAQRTALEFSDATMSYAELHAAARTMAGRLAERGVKSGDAVGVLLERSAAMVVSWLGALELGAAYVPLDVEQPPARLAGMLQDAHCAVVVCTAAQLPLLGDLPMTIERADVPRVAPPLRSSQRAPRGDDVAHVIFTSGSTGRPKGVRIPHRGVARLALGIRWASFEAGERFAQTSNPAFDATTYEVWSSLLNGCTLVEIDRDTVLQAPALQQRLKQTRIDHLFLTTALFTRLAAERPDMFSSLKSLMTGGAKAEVGSFLAVLAAGPPKLMLNAYGPTETTVLGSVWVAQALPDEALSVPIGRPVTNTTCYVLDDRLRPVPHGAPGQLYIGGPGVALGYVGRPELDAECFVDDPWQPGGRLYASGDKVRWRHDGQLEFLGRFDDQVKIRGFRVEPGEVATVLSTHPAVRSAVVAARERAGGETALDAYVVLHDDLGAAFDAVARGEAAGQLVEHWRALYDTVVYDALGATPTFNTAGWNDSATGAPILASAMAEQVEQTVQRVLGTAAKCVLEIGCGTGLLLFRIAPACERYAAVDVSAAAVEHVRRTAAGDPRLSHVELAVASALDLDGLASGSFDLVLLNSVVQYFPSFDYLVRAVRAAVARLRPGGRVLLGDLRHIGLMHAFHADVVLQRAAPAAMVASLRDELQRRLNEEQELALAPAALHELARQVPGLRLEWLQLKRGQHRNELSRFRYDALLRWADGEPVRLKPVALHWERDLGGSLQALQAALAQHEVRAVRVLALPNDRVLQAQRLAQAIGSAADDAPAASLPQALEPAAAVNPEALWALGERLQRPARVLWNPLDDAAFDVVFAPLGAPQSAVEEWPDPRAALPLAELCTNPLHGHFARRLVPELKAHLAARLPAYMWPDHVVRLKQLPLTPNGKVDKSALPAPERLRPQLQQAHVAARTDTERRLAASWAQLLAVEPPGVHDHFFNDLGGHSLLATQAMSRLRSEFGIELPLRVIFERPTIAELAQVVEEAQATGAAPAPIAAPGGDALAELDVDALDEAQLDAALARLGAAP